MDEHERMRELELADEDLHAEEHEASGIVDLSSIETPQETLGSAAFVATMLVALAIVLAHGRERFMAAAEWSEG